MEALVAAINPTGLHLRELDVDGHSPLYLAALRGREAAAGLLLDAGAGTGRGASVALEGAGRRRDSAGAGNPAPGGAGNANPGAPNGSPKTRRRVRWK